MANNEIGDNIILIVLGEIDDLKIETLLSLMVKFSQNYKVIYEIITILMEYLLLEKHIKPSIEQILLNNNKFILELLKKEISNKSNQEFISALLIYQYNFIISSNSRCIYVDEMTYLSIIDENFFNLFYNCKSFLVVDLMQFLYVILINVNLNNHLRNNLLYIISMTIGTFISLSIDSLIKNDSSLEINSKILASYIKLYATYIENYILTNQEVSVGIFNSGLIQNLILYYGQDKFILDEKLSDIFLIRVFCSMGYSSVLTLKEVIKINYLDALKNILKTYENNDIINEIFVCLHNLCNEPNIVDEIIKSEIFELAFTKIRDTKVKLFLFRICII